jgi:hypothetical protein
VYREDVFHNFSNAVRGFCCVLRDMVRPTFLEALMTKTFFRLCAVALLAAPLASNATQAQTSAIPRPAPSPAADYGRLPLSFEPNRGQADPSVQFLSRGSHYIVLLQPNTATLLLDRTAAKSALQPAPSQRSAIRMTLKGSSPTATMSPEKPLAGYVNYLTGDKSHSYTGLPTYAATRVASAYQGIDVVYYGTDRQLEYDFVVAPHSDPAQIHLAIDGAHPTLEADGTVRLQIALPKRDTDIIFHKPVLYQQIDGKRHPIDGAFSVAANGEISFRVGSYDPARELIIDPVIGYGSYFGGNVQDEINGSALNASNQLYAVGQTLSPTLFSTSGEFQSGPYGGVQRGWDGFVTKFSADGSTVLWTTYLAGSGDDFATAVAVNSSDQAYVVGNTDSCLYASEAEPNQNNDPNAALPIVHFPVTSDAVQQLCSPNVSYLNQNPSAPYESEGTNTTTFLAKLSSDGKTELYGTPIGGSSGDYASSIVLDATGRPYIVGETYSTAYVKCSTAKTDCDVPSYPVDQHGNADIGLANYPTTSNAFYSSTIESQTYPTLCVGCPPTQDEQAFITVLSADLHSFVYSSLIGGPVIGGCGNGACNTNGIAVAVNAAGQAFIGGNTSSAHWPVTAGAFAATCPNAGAATSQCPMTGWLAGFDPSKSGAASLLFTTYLTGSSAGLDSNGNPLYPGGDVYGLAVDSKGNVVATGDTNADNFPTTAGTFEPTCVQFSDGNGNSKRCQSAYITKLSPTGATVWSTYFTPRTQPGNFVIGNGVALDANADPAARASHQHQPGAERRCLRHRDLPHRRDRADGHVPRCERQPYRRQQLPASGQQPQCLHQRLSGLLHQLHHHLSNDSPRTGHRKHGRQRGRLGTEAHYAAADALDRSADHPKLSRSRCLHRLYRNGHRSVRLCCSNRHGHPVQRLQHTWHHHLKQWYRHLQHRRAGSWHLQRHRHLLWRHRLRDQRHDGADAVHPEHTCDRPHRDTVDGNHRHGDRAQGDA